MRLIRLKANQRSVVVPFFKFAAVILLVIGLIDTVFANPVVTGKMLAESRFKNWTYGKEPAKKQIDCVQFVLAVIEEELTASLNDEIRRAILINYGWSEAEVQLYVGTGTDKRIAGVQYGLADLAGRGTKVDPSEVKVGDFIQYWMKKRDGTWFGHCGIVSSVAGTKVGIYGAQLSQNKIADSEFKLDLLGNDRRIYIVRLKP